MHRQKTGALIQASVLLGAISAGLRMLREHAALDHFGAEIGLAFQIQDDILDVEGNTTTLGKRAGADADRVKPTYPSVLGLEEARAEARRGATAPSRRCRPGSTFRTPGEFAGLPGRAFELRPCRRRPCPPCKLRRQCPQASTTSRYCDRRTCRRSCARCPRTACGEICTELREYLIRRSPRVGGHFGAGLGVIELTVALHYLFDTPDDRLVWDVGHQCYPHKILTGRRDAIDTIKQNDGARAVPARAGERVRHLRRRPLVDLDLRRAGHGGRRAAQRRRPQRSSR